MNLKKIEGFMNRLSSKIIIVIDIVLSIIFAGISLVVLVLTVVDFWHIFVEILKGGNFNQIMHYVLNVLIYSEILAMSRAYYQEKHKIPVRYFLYIVITTVARHAILAPDDIESISRSLFYLVISYLLISIVNKIYDLKD